MTPSINELLKSGLRGSFRFEKRERILFLYFVSVLRPCKS